MTNHTPTTSQNLATLRIFWQANWKYKRYFITTSTTWLSGLILQKLGLPLIAARAINLLIQQDRSGQAIVWNGFIPYIITFTVVAIAAQVLIVIGLYNLTKLETKARPDLQNRVFNMFMAQSLRFHANNFSGSLVSQTNKFTGAYVALTDVFLLQIMQLLVNVVLAIVVIAYFSPLIALVIFTWSVLFTTLNVVLTRQRMPLSRRAAAADTVLTGHLADSIANVSAIKSFSHESHEGVTHYYKTQDWAAKKFTAWIRAIQSDAAFGALMSLLQLLVLILSIYGVMRGTVSIATLLLIQVYIAQIIGQLWGLSSISRNIEQQLSDASEMTELLQQPSDVADPPQPQPLKLKHGLIRFQDISFAHDGEGEALFRNFTLHIQPGEKVGLIGHSGSGKTSLTKLLLRFADVDEGRIAIDNQDIRSVSQADLRSKIAYVPQEPLLFHRTIRENIAYGNLEANTEQIEAAARQARAAEFIEKLTKGYDTMVGERGIKLSGGQRQRIAIARAIIKNAPILVLDEATSALDSESEKYIQEALTELMENRTVIVIAHRLSTIQRMDRIVVLDEGRITEQGSHQDLLKTKGTYAKLWSHQSGGFIED